MNQQSGETKRWNLFARELEDLLSKYDWSEASGPVVVVISTAVSHPGQH